LEAKLLQRTQQLEEANNNKDEFLGTLAHELRSPLAAVSMAVDILRENPSSEDIEQLWSIIRRQTNQMLHLVEDLMDVSRIAHAKVRVQKIQVDLEPLISQAIEAVQPLFSVHKQQLTFSFPPEPVKLMADPVRLVEVFTNLLSNAAKYTYDEGHISLLVAEENEEVVIEFRDTGIGITAEMLPRVFDPFTQVTDAINRSEGGIGIGLAMVAHLVRLHKGTVNAFSDGPGKGSRFVVRLPLPSMLETAGYSQEMSGLTCLESGSRCNNHL
jgi:signal transduction histidine kinase